MKAKEVHKLSDEEIALEVGSAAEAAVRAQDAVDHGEDPGHVAVQEDS